MADFLFSEVKADRCLQVSDDAEIQSQEPHFHQVFLVWSLTALHDAVIFSGNRGFILKQKALQFIEILFFH